LAATFSEKVLGAKTGEVVTVSPDYILSHDNTAAISLKFAQLGVNKVKCPDKIIIILDHVVPAATEKYAQNHKIIREFVEKQGISNFFDIHNGICHQVLAETPQAMAHLGLFQPGSGVRK